MVDHLRKVHKKEDFDDVTNMCMYAEHLPETPQNKNWLCHHIFIYLDELLNILIIYPSSNLIHVSFISDKNNFLKVCNLSLQVSMIVVIYILQYHNLLLTHVQRLIFFSRKSNSTFRIVHYSVCNQNPSTAWHCHHSSLILPSFRDF